MNHKEFCSAQDRASLRKHMSAVKKKSDFQRIQCVLLRAEHNMKAEQVAAITCLQAGTVRKIWSDFRRFGAEVLLEKERGGRRNSYLSREEESLFLKPFFKKARQGHPIDATEIRLAYEELVQKKIPKSTIYRLLARNGWNKKVGSAANVERSKSSTTDMKEYWIEGCAQVLHPKRTGNISQQWLNQTLSSMVNDTSIV
jgi:transposase